MEVTVIRDTDLFALHYGKDTEKPCGIVCRGMNIINFEACAAGFRYEHRGASEICVGERKMDEYSFVFYTGAAKTKVVFSRRYVCGLFRRSLFVGTRAQRFLALQRLIGEAGYTTLDLS